MFKWKDVISGFPVSQGHAAALDRWGGKTMHRLISYFLSNTSAKNCHNRIGFGYVKIITSQRWDVFWDSVFHHISETLEDSRYEKWKGSHMQSVRPWVTLTIPNL